MSIGNCCKTGNILHGSHREDQELVILARVRGLDGEDITQVTISSVSVRVFDLGVNRQIGTTLSPTVLSTVYDTLQKNNQWTVDSIGYNFRYVVPASYFPGGDIEERIEVMFTPTVGSPFFLIVEVSVDNVLTS